LLVETTDGCVYPAHLVVAADGIDSAVRTYLAAPPPTSSSSSSSSWLHSKRRSFGIKRYRSPSTGLRVKSLQFPPSFTLPNVNGTTVTSVSENLYAIRSIYTGPRNYLSLGMLPVKDPNMIRPANVITRPDHVLWKLTTGAAVKEWFGKAFPRMDFETLVDDAEWERFAASRGTAFPYCQHSKGLAVHSKDNNCGVVLVGDSAHAFPPDIGQGINSGLQDVVALDKALRGEATCIVKRSNNTTTTTTSMSPPENLGQALDRYEQNRKGEHRALIRLARFGSPYQYNQPWRKDKIGKKLWTANVVLRMFLTKVSRGWIPPAAILLAQGNALTFRQVMRRADTTVNVIKASLVLSVAWFIARRVAFPALP
jgi:kynurenine 3-monooxygenase